MKQRYWFYAKQYVWVGSACYVEMVERHGYIPRDSGCGFHIGALQVQSPWRLHLVESLAGKRANHHTGVGEKTRRNIST